MDNDKYIYAVISNPSDDYIDDIDFQSRLLTATTKPEIALRRIKESADNFCYECSVEKYSLDGELLKDYYAGEFLNEFLFRKKLNNIIKECCVTAYGFPAFKGLEERSKSDSIPVVISTLSAAVMADMGIFEYYSPVIPRDTIYKTTDDVIAADLDVNLVFVEHMDDITASDPVIIVSRHAGTIDLLRSMYPNNIVLASISPDDIRDKTVVGALPPHLIQHAGRFKGFAIRNFDYNTDSDLSGEELRERMIITGTIKVTVI